MQNRSRLGVGLLIVTGLCAMMALPGCHGSSSDPNAAPGATKDGGSAASSAGGGQPSNAKEQQILKEAGEEKHPEGK